MKKNKKLLNIFIILLGAIIVVLLFYMKFYKNNNPEKEITFKILDDEIDLRIDDTKMINYSISDDSLHIDWLSSNDSVKVNSNGEITALDYGLATITGIIEYKDKRISSFCYVNPYSGDIGVSIDKASVPYDYILMKPNSEYDLPFSITPENAYISSIDYHIGNTDIIEVKDKKIISKNPGKTTLQVYVNDSLYFATTVKVDASVETNHTVSKVESVTINNIGVMEMGETKTLSYEVVPKDGLVNEEVWESSNEDIITVKDGVLEAKNVGLVNIYLTINGKIKTFTQVKVESSKEDIIIDSNPKTLIRIGERTNINAHINLANINDDIYYWSHYPNKAKIENGVITGVDNGSTEISLSISNGKRKVYTINVLPKNGVINGTANLWGYKSLNSKVPVLADSSFYQSLAQKGIGVISGNSYLITSSNENYTYDISSSVLSVNNKRIKLRIYYPKVDDLSTLNTLVYMGGRGETNFEGAFNDIKNDPSLIKSGGIVALLAEGNNTSFDGESGAYVTKFLKAITKQKSGVKNSILGFSDGAHQVLNAAYKENYDKIIIFSGYADGARLVENAKNSEVILIIASNDGNYSQAKSTLNNMVTNGYKNVTFVSNGNDLSSFSNRALIINPGNLMKNGHYSINVINSGIIEYAND